MDFKIYNNILSDDNISYILNNIDTSQYHSGRVGNRINLKQKIRKDLFIKDNSLLKYIDDTFYDKMYNDIQTNFSNIKYREMLTMGSMYAGLAFSNTKTAISHNISYPITLKHGVPHGIACSFTLPAVLKSIIGIDKVCDNNFRTLFGEDLEQGPKILKDFFKSIDISTDPKSYIGNSNEWNLIVSEAFEGERGKNFIGNLQSLNKAQDFMGL